MRFAIAAVTVLLSAPAIAGPPLWQNVSAGMSVDVLRSLYPPVKGKVHHKGDRTIIEDVQQIARCHPKVIVYHPGGIVSKVEIHSQMRGFPKETCGDAAATALIGKYGTPTATDEARTPNLLVPQRDTFQTWIKDGVSIEFNRYNPETDDDWTIVYAPVKNIGL
ncbi:hypothetical protein ACFB49_42850 [Sphingomonas sp. DBB INV C78]|uniref:hypothetical protein n=1 Tax=Sphingomonas sp. DBB INV C78 TaxID=3349434 RepID=UPI0036D2DAF7